MKKYYVIINGEKKQVARKSEADAVLIDAFLSGAQGIDWTIYENDPEPEPVRAVDILKTISVFNWYCGKIDAFYAWSNNCTISKSDANKVRKALKKYGYKCNIYGGIICNLSK